MSSAVWNVKLRLDCSQLYDTGPPILVHCLFTANSVTYSLARDGGGKHIMDGVLGDKVCLPTTKNYTHAARDNIRHIHTSSRHTDRGQTDEGSTKTDEGQR